MTSDTPSSPSEVRGEGLVVTATRGPGKALALTDVGVCYRRRTGLLSGRRVGFWALEDVSLDLHVRETLGVVGRNGGGKSTLLRLLAGIIKPDRGTVETYGYQATLLSLQVGFVDYLTGRENVVISGLLLGMARREIEEKMSSIIAFAELEDFIDEPIQTYSSGMRARLGFSTAVHVEPDILLIDETLGVGDAEFQEKSTRMMREKLRSDQTVVLVSHSLQLIRSVCDRVVWIERGRTNMAGSPDDVIAAYRESVERARAARA